MELRIIFNELRRIKQQQTILEQKNKRGMFEVVFTQTTVQTNFLLNTFNINLLEL